MSKILLYAIWHRFLPSSCTPSQRERERERELKEKYAPKCSKTTVVFLLGCRLNSQTIKTSLCSLPSLYFFPSAAEYLTYRHRWIYVGRCPFERASRVICRNWGVGFMALYFIESLSESNNATWSSTYILGYVHLRGFFFVDFMLIF